MFCNKSLWIEEVESYLSQWDEAELRKKQLLHKRWTGPVWTAVQKKVEEQMSNRVTEAKMRQSLYSHYLHHCNSKVFDHSKKRFPFTGLSCFSYFVQCRELQLTLMIHFYLQGFVFLESYDPNEYNPFLLNIKKPNLCQVRLFHTNTPNWLNRRWLFLNVPPRSWHYSICSTP